MNLQLKNIYGGLIFEGEFVSEAALVMGALKAGKSAYRANLSCADLSCADLTGANLSRADLYNANLSNANLSRAKSLHSYAQVAFKGHGECGRMLSAILTEKDAKPKVFCGCFQGDFDELEKYIAGGDAKYRKTRTLAMNAVREMLYAENEEATT